MKCQLTPSEQSRHYYLEACSRMITISFIRSANVGLAMGDNVLRIIMSTYWMHMITSTNSFAPDVCCMWRCLLKKRYRRRRYWWAGKCRHQLKAESAYTAPCALKITLFIPKFDEMTSHLCSCGAGYYWCASMACVLPVSGWQPSLFARFSAGLVTAVWPVHSSGGGQQPFIISAVFRQNLLRFSRVCRFAVTKEGIRSHFSAAAARMAVI